jgi:hypothetical protein
MADVIAIEDVGIPIAEILSEKYPDLEWSLSGNDYDRLIVFNGDKPTLADLEVFAAEVTALVAERKVEHDKRDVFQSQYALQDQIIVVGRAVLLGDTTELKTMLDYLDAL